MFFFNFLCASLESYAYLVELEDCQGCIRKVALKVDT